MLKKLMFSWVLVLMISSILIPHHAQAHFMIRDSKTGVHALFHVTPDHKPVAGKSSVISFDFSRTGYDADDFTYRLRIKGTEKSVATVPVEVAGNVVLADYTFPVQGFYNIELAAASRHDSTTSILVYGQRVSRGVMHREKSAMPLIVVTLAGTLLVAGAAVTIGFKDDIIKQKGKNK